MANIGLPALKSVLNAPSVQEQFYNALKENKDTFIASIIDLYGSDPQLAQCDNSLIVKECLRAATMHLPINRALGYAYVIVFNNKVKYVDDKGKEQYRYEKTPVFITSKKGIVQLALRTRIYKCINYDIIYEGELVEKNKLTGELVIDEKQRVSDKVIGYFAHFETVYGMKKTFFMTVEQVARHAKLYSPTVKFNPKVTVESLKLLAGQPPTGLGWTGDFDNMALKTVLGQLLERFGELSTEIQTALATEKLAEFTTEPTENETPDVNIEDIKFEEVAQDTAAASQGKTDVKKDEDVKLEF